MAGLREHQKAGRRKRILEAARRHFLESGYDAATIEAIAETAEVSAVTVYNYYGTKRGLLLALVGQSDGILIGKINAFIADPPDDPLEAVTGVSTVIRDHALGYLDKPIWRHVIATSVIEGSSEFGRGYAALDRTLGGLIGTLLETLARRGAPGPGIDRAAVGGAAIDWAAIDNEAAGETLFKLQNARFVEFMADDAVTPNEMDRRVRQDIALVLGQYLAAKPAMSA